jgi:hypothetical protein
VVHFIQNNVQHINWIFLKFLKLNVVQNSFSEVKIDKRFALKVTLR